ncbi:M1 family metallopeptidase [Patescibacteria group bacterium]|nr:M1 family metallopeptidase [Patescibacteria group bacterium]
MSVAKNSVRLSINVVPERYAIKLAPDLEKFTFEGEETITVRVAKATRTVTLHAKELDIESAEVVVGERKSFADKISYDEKAETMTLQFALRIPQGEAKIRIIFRGILNDKLRGFYRSQYFVAGERRHMATTQFESTDARRAFPCFDEPAKKAVFDVTLLVPKHTVAISNTLPVSEEEREDGLREVVFESTPKMSTYLLAFIVGEFEHIETRTKEGTLVRVFTTPGKIHQAKFALECAAKTLSFYNNYFAIPYPLPVLDLIAIPDFSAGAMENWGAITYRESAILVDPKHSSAATKQWVALVIAHEIAHQWFGNLVTMEWWTHLWLNEGFASYIEYLAVDKLFPKWQVWTQFAYLDLSRALSLDALKNTHPIEVPVHHPDEIAEIFDEVSYSKGASVIRMLADYLGENDFRDGLRLYLKRHSYGNASTIHLWRAFEKVSRKPVARIMKNWTGQSGHPVVEVKEKAGKIELSQKRFFSNPFSARRGLDKTVWAVPVAIGGAKRKVDEVLLERKGTSLPRRSGAVDWFKINFGETGFFRTAYSPALLERLRPALRAGRLSELDRLGLIRDAFALAEGGVSNTTDALALASEYSKEKSYTVWAELALHLRRVFNIISDTPTAENYRKFARAIFASAAAKVGWRARQGESHNETLLRSLILANSGDYGDAGIVETARKMFFDFLNRGKVISADLRGAVYGIGAKYASEREFKKLMTLYCKESLHEEQGRLAHALGSFRDKKLLQKTLEFALSKNVRIQDTLGIIASVWGNPEGRDLAWQFVKKHWSTFLERYGSGGYALSRLVKAGGVFHDKAHYDDFKKFFKTHPAPGAGRAIEQVLEKIDSNIQWLARDGKSVAKRFTEK